jgi:hypothetical protein
MTKSTPPGEELIRALADFDLSVGEIALALREMALEEEPAAVEKLFRGIRTSVLVFAHRPDGGR